MERGQPSGILPAAPHWLAVAFAALVLSAVVHENLDGYHNHWGGDYRDEPPIINWAHGWPWYFMVRSSLDFGTNGIPPGPILTPPGGFYHYSPWPFDDAPLAIFSVTWLVADCAVGLLVVIGAGVAADTWARRWRLRNQFGLRAIFVLVTFASVACVAVNPLQYSTVGRYVLHYAALTVLGVAAAAILTTGALWAAGSIRACIARLKIRGLLAE
jgi:hypothetical protein